jgi:UDP-GlcNAc3NAcA epimerase
MKICTVIGARPQFIKAAVISQAIRLTNEIAYGSAPLTLEEAIIHTGQHFDQNMSQVFFEELLIPQPKHNLGIGGGTHGQNTGRMIEAIETSLLSERPSWVVLFGDTDSTLAGAIAAAKLNIPIAHIEAGLRSFNRLMPEEINRILTDHCSNLLFTPSDVATRNLASEGIQGDCVQQVGDVMYDAALLFGRLAIAKSKILSTLRREPNGFVLATIHRAENTNDTERLRQIIKGLGSANSVVVWPMHPRTRKRIEELKITLPDNLQVVGPVGYLDMVQLEQSAILIVTDSGGVQKEAYFHRVPCVTIRDETEWTETVSAGWNRLVAAEELTIAKAIHSAVKPTGMCNELYGDGNAAQKILRGLCQWSEQYGGRPLPT